MERREKQMTDTTLSLQGDIPEELEKEEEQITEMFMKYSDEILRLCLLYLKDYHLAEDALQETFLRITKHIGSFRGQSSEKTWIVRIAINVCKTILTAKQKEEAESFAGEEWEHFSLVEQGRDDLERILQRSVVSQGVMQLEEKYREVIILYFYQELKLREIAKITGDPMTTVAYRLRQGKKLLRKVLERHGD